MKKRSSNSFRPRIFLGFLLCSSGAMLAMLSLTPPNNEPNLQVASSSTVRLERDMPGP